MQAATAELDQYHSFTEPEIIGYLADCYPVVHEEFRRPLVLAAVSGAQRAAHLYVVVEKTRRLQMNKVWGGSEFGVHALL